MLRRSEELQKNRANKMAIYCTFHSLQEEMDEHEILPDFRKYIKKMSELDDTWKFCVLKSDHDTELIHRLLERKINHFL